MAIGRDKIINLAVQFFPIGLETSFFLVKPLVFSNAVKMDYIPIIPDYGLQPICRYGQSLCLGRGFGLVFNKDALDFGHFGL